MRSAGACLRIAEGSSGEHLHGNLAIELRVARADDLSHPPFADRGKDGVAAAERRSG
jgi:hypothetical protein